MTARWGLNTFIALRIKPFPLHLQSTPSDHFAVTPEHVKKTKKKKRDAVIYCLSFELQWHSVKNQRLIEETQVEPL